LSLQQQQQYQQQQQHQQQNGLEEIFSLDAAKQKSSTVTSKDKSSAELPNSRSKRERHTKAEAERLIVTF
jgi:hypothetical protein